YIMTELGQPMHAFDADKIEGNIIVRQAKDGETILALDGREYTLSHKDLVIADSKKPIAIAGIIGGMDSAVSETTRNVFFESACFDPVSVRLTAQRLGIRTDASMRYEKSLDPLLAETALPRIFDLLAFIKKTGTFDGDFTYLDTDRVNLRKIGTDIDFVEKKLGLPIPKADIENILHRLGFEVSWAGNEFTAQVPSWRATKDIAIKEDLVEEIGRIHGYEQVPDTPILGPFSIARRNHEIELRDQVNAYFSARGLFEVYNYSFSNQEKDAKIGLEDDDNAIHIRNAFNVEHTVMRRSLTPALLAAVRENLKQSDSFGLFETGKIFERLEENTFSERKNIAGVLVGQDMMKLREMLDGFVHSVLPGMGFEVIQGTQNSA
ncbi:MAG: phenylalanine--tRNA ligase subunit beta, partial [Candidatus Gracilibacteria bacterium]|nr:phenylalanine--tRNA ligase subunit beta [Candidatus Gracilibacteria bacterium]